MKSAALAIFLSAALGAGLAQAAAPAFRWVAANEFYFIAPAPQTLRVEGAGSASVNPWGIGFRGVGSEAFSKTGAVQLQSVTVDKPATGRNTFYLLELLLGMQYISPKAAGRALRFTAAGYADLGLADSTLYAAPVLTAGLLYTANAQADTPNGLTFDLYYRLTDVKLDNAGSNRAGALKPALGFKVGYIFEGFWTTAARPAL
jgi:hypothetical protein